MTYVHIFIKISNRATHCGLPFYRTLFLQPKIHHPRNQSTNQPHPHLHTLAYYDCWLLKISVLTMTIVEMATRVGDKIFVFLYNTILHTNAHTNKGTNIHTYMQWVCTYIHFADWLVYNSSLYRSGSNVCSFCYNLTLCHRILTCMSTYRHLKCFVAPSHIYSNGV